MNELDISADSDGWEDDEELEVRPSLTNTSNDGFSGLPILEFTFDSSGNVVEEEGAGDDKESGKKRKKARAAAEYTINDHMIAIELHKGENNDAGLRLSQKKKEQIQAS